MWRARHFRDGSFIGSPYIESNVTGYTVTTTTNAGGGIDKSCCLTNKIRPISGDIDPLLLASWEDKCNLCSDAFGNDRWAG